MKTGLICVLALCGCLGFASTPATAGTAEAQANGSTVWQAGVEGIEIEWNADGTVKRISSKFSTPIEFADRRGISKAQIIAEEKAKAAIIRFLNQSVSSTRVVAEVQNDVNKAVQERQTGAAAKVNKVDERTLIENLTEVTTSFAKGALRGVIILEKGYDSKTEEAWVVVGISDKTIAATRGVRQMQTAPQSTSPPMPDGATQSTQPLPEDALRNQPSEVRRSNQKDW
jgi:hypothetical protein